jgi:MFS family permease
MPFVTMRDFTLRLRGSTGLFEPGSVALAVMILTALAFFRVALLPEFGGELAMSTFQLGAVTTVFAVGRLVADLPGGHLADRFPAPRIMAASASGVALGSLLLAGADSVQPVYVAAFLLGISSATTNATGMTYYSNAGGGEFRGTSMAVFSAALLGGQALGPAVAGLVAAAAGWRPAMVAAAVMAAAVAMFLALGRRVGRPGPRATVERRVTGRGGVPRLGAMMVLQSVSFAVFLTLGAVSQTLIPLIGSDDLGLGAAAIGLALGAGGFARFVGTLIGGRLSDRMSRKAALVPGLMGQAVGVGLLALPPSGVLWVAAILVMSLASYAVPVAATILGDISDPNRVGAQLGRFRFVGDIGLIVGPVSVTALYQGVGREVAFSAVAGLLVAVGLVCWRILPETAPTAA